jgi:hypothetical protein
MGRNDTDHSSLLLLSSENQSLLSKTTINLAHLMGTFNLYRLRMNHEQVSSLINLVLD